MPTSLEVLNNLTGKVVHHSGQGTTTVTHGGSVFTVTFGGSLSTIAHVESLRLNVTNPLPLTLANQTVPGVDFLIGLKGIDGDCCIDDRRATIAPGKTIVADFNRDEVPAEGEPGSGRLPRAVEITWRVSLTHAQLNALGNSLQFPISFEFVDNLTGKTTVFSPVTRSWFLRNSN